jgi:hypothetical protein
VWILKLLEELILKPKRDVFPVKEELNLEYDYYQLRSFEETLLRAAACKISPAC